MEGKEDELAYHEWPVKAISVSCESEENFLKNTCQRANKAADADDEICGMLNTRKVLS